jgi:hypothetical protein
VRPLAEIAEALLREPITTLIERGRKATHDLHQRDEQHARDIDKQLAEAG